MTTQEAEHLTRRQFLKGSGMALGSLLLPAGMLAWLDTEVWTVSLDDALFRRAVRIMGTEKDDNGELYLKVEFDMQKMWQSVTMIDAQGREWHTLDGAHWSNGRDSFEVPDAA